MSTPRAFKTQAKHLTLPDQLLRCSGASWDRFDKEMTTQPESCSKHRQGAFRKTSSHPCVFKPRTKRRWKLRRAHPPSTPSKPKKKWTPPMIFPRNFNGYTPVISVVECKFSCLDPTSLKLIKRRFPRPEADPSHDFHSKFQRITNRKGFRV